MKGTFSHKIVTAARSCSFHFLSSPGAILDLTLRRLVPIRPCLYCNHATHISELTKGHPSPKAGFTGWLVSCQGVSLCTTGTEQQKSCYLCFALPHEFVKTTPVCALLVLLLVMAFSF